MDELIVPVIAIITTIGLPIVTGLVLGIILMKNKHKERMGLINQGIIPPDRPKRKPIPNRLVSLRNGIILLSIGIGLSVGLLLGRYMSIDEEYIFWVVSASILLFLGLGYLIYFLVTKNIPIEPETDIIE